MAHFITCDYCGSNVDIETNTECPNCGAKFSEDEEYLDWKLTHEDEDIRLARRERIELAAKKTLAEKNKAEAEKKYYEAAKNRSEALKNHETQQSLSIINSMIYGVQRYFRNLRRGCSFTLTIIVLVIIIYLVYKLLAK
ncbi:MAG: hypothetical protein WBH77_01660 [Saccharofermentanales bacterium]